MPRKAPAPPSYEDLRKSLDADVRWVVRIFLANHPGHEELAAFVLDGVRAEMSRVLARRPK